LLLNNDIGLHPSWTGLKSAYTRGELVVFPTAGISVGNSGSHEEATRDVIWGLYDGMVETRRKGFVADILDTKYAGTTAAEFLGFDMAPGNSVLNDSVAQIIKASNITNLGFNGGITGDSGLTQDTIFLLGGGWQGSDSDGKVTRTVRSLESTQVKIRQAISGTSFTPAFPNTGIGGAFSQTFVAISNFINSGLEAVTISNGGFDTHNNQDPVVAQGQPVMGVSASFQAIDQAIDAFYQNLTRVGLWNQVTVLLISEFGRTARENGSKGTDHGHATTYLMTGGSVNGGQVVGSLVQPGDFQRGNNSFPVSVPLPSIVSQISEKLGVARNRIYPDSVLGALPAIPNLFK
jgi:uncharacterized protein (DUF1501 family)